MAKKIDDERISMLFLFVLYFISLALILIIWRGNVADDDVSKDDYLFIFYATGAIVVIAAFLMPIYQEREYFEKKYELCGLSYDGNEFAYFLKTAAGCEKRKIDKKENILIEKTEPGESPSVKEIVCYDRKRPGVVWVTTDGFCEKKGLKEGNNVVLRLPPGDFAKIIMERKVTSVYTRDAIEKPSIVSAAQNLAPKADGGKRK